MWTRPSMYLVAIDLRIIVHFPDVPGFDKCWVALVPAIPVASYLRTYMSALSAVEIRWGTKQHIGTCAAGANSHGCRCWLVDARWLASSLPDQTAVTVPCCSTVFDTYVMDLPLSSSHAQRR